MNNEYKCFEIYLEALSPISITKRNFAILSETYTYIPSWTMWNAFVKLYALQNIQNKIDYKGAKEKLKFIRLTNFYILDNNGPILELKDEDRKNYISSDLKNAINLSTNTSLEGALYEREYIYAKKFIGWIRIESSCNILENFFKQLKEKVFFVGADKNTGFGKIKIDGIENCIDLEERPPKYLNEPKNNNYLLPVEMEENEFFPFILREWDEEEGSGMKIIKKI